MKIKASKLRKKAGFSLVELLIVIAVIGSMAAIAIPMISNINVNATTAKDKSNAQDIASVYGAAAAAGAAISTISLDDACNSLQFGITGTGRFSTSTFKVNISDTEESAARTATSMALSNGVLTYTP